jgi:chromosomal replication initiator protein
MELIRSDTEIVPALRAALVERIGQERFELWFGPHARLGYDGRALSIAVPSPLLLNFIRANFRREIEEACESVFGECPAVQLGVDPTLATAEVPSMRKDEPEHAPPRQGRPAHAATEGSPAPQASAASGNGHCRRRFATLSSFVRGDCNRLALTAAERVLRDPGQISPLTIYGPTSVGKTHLLEGIWTAARRRRGLRVLYLTSEQFTTYFLEALRGGGLPSFRRKYRGVDLLILDDVHFLVGKRATQIELLHTVDTLLQEGRQLVLAADRAPGELKGLSPELVTRLRGGAICQIEPPDFATRLGILRHLAERLDIEVPPAVQRFVASRITSHARDLSGALCRLHATSEAHGCPITAEMAEEALADLIRQTGRAVRLGDIEKAVCDAFGVERATMHSQAKAKHVSQPRMLAMWLARKHTRAALTEIGHYFNRKSHSTVVSAQKRIDRWIADAAEIEMAGSVWKIEDAIRQVERKLQAG